MKKFFLHMVLVSVLGMLTVSCNDTEMVEYLDTNTTQVMFSLGMDSPVTRSRAADGEDNANTENKINWGDTDNYDHAIGDAYDNRINPDQLYVKITHGGKTYEVKKILKWQDKDDASLHTFVGEVDIDLNGQPKRMEDAKIEVFANWNPDAENGDVFSQSAQYIPMWGVQTATITLTPGKRETLNTIYLLRAMAKIQVSLNDEMVKEYSLSEVTLNKHNATGICLPTGAEGAANTKELGLEDVLNAKKSSEQTPLAFKKDGDSYVVYLPEVVNDGSSEDDWLKISVKLKETATGSEEEGSFFIKDYSDENSPVAIDIIRNHWYKYIVKGFAASQIFVDYKALDWQGVEMEIGGDGFLFLNKDVIEIYNSNIDTDQLKFSSSSPIKSITLKDIYKHERNGSFTEGTLDGVYAYYMDKFGVLTQLSAEEGTDEATVLANISATVKEENKKVLNGGIVINSPFMADKDASETALQSDSHYNTVRYLEFEVENEQGLLATFRVMQYPPVVITNEEGFFSYRDDHQETDDDKPTHYQNFKGLDNLFLSGLMLYHEHDWTDEAEQSAEWHALPIAQRSYAWLATCPQQGTGDKGWEELRYGYGRNTVSWGTQTATFSGAHRSTVEPTERFLRERYNGMPGATNMDTKGAAVGPPYERNGRIYRKHYVWNLQPVFYPKFVGKVYSEDGTVNIVNTKYQEKQTYKYYQHTTTQVSVQNRYETVEKQQGKADIYKLDATSNGWDIWPSYTYVYNWYYSGRWRSEVTSSNMYKTPEVYLVNHRMYNVKTSVSTDEYNLGYVTLVDENGNQTLDSNIGVTANTVVNASKVSPSFAVASQLGETAYATVVKTAATYNYILPSVKSLYNLAERHCKYYVETTYKDLNNNYQYDEGEPVTHYHDWRLPTKKEIEMIIDYQDNSRAMDRLLTCQYYFCVTGNGDSNDVANIHNWVSSEIPNFDSTSTGYYIRCVRDVKPEGQNGVVEKE